MATLASLTVRLGIDTGPLSAGAARAKATLLGLGKAVGSLGVGVPAAAAVSLAVGGMAAAFATAGVAAGAFGLAVKPQIAAMQESSAAADKVAKAQENQARKKAVADKLSAQGSDLAKKAATAYTSARLATKDAEEAYARQTKGMPKETANAALAFANLKTKFQSWSDSLSSTTMPIFTKGFKILTALIPHLTPLVQAASKAFKDFLDNINVGAIGDGLETIANFAEKNLGSLLRSFQNIAVGVGGIIAAFLPVSGDMAGGFEKATKKFADFGKGLGKSEGFAKFVKLAKDGGKELGTLAEAALKLAVALGPLIGTTTKIADGMAKIIGATPPSVLSLIAGTILAISIAMKLWAIGAAVVTTATTLWAAAQAILNAAFWTSPIFWIVIAIVALIAVIVLIATKTTWFQTAWSAVWGAIKSVWNTVYQFLTNGLGQLCLLLMGPVGVLLLVWNNWDTIWGAIKSATSTVVDAIKSILHWFAGLGHMFAGWFTAAKNAVVSAFNATVNWLKAFPGRAKNALASLAGFLAAVAVHAGTSFINSIKSKGSSAISWIKGIPGRAKSAMGSLGGILTSAGRSIIQGFINGIKGMIGSVKSTLGGITHSLTSWKGPESLDKKILTPNGEMVIGGFMAGIENAVPALRRQLGGVTQDLSDMAVGVTPSGVFRTSNQTQSTLKVEVTGPDEVKRLIRTIVQKDGRGNVQTAFGR